MSRGILQPRRFYLSNSVVRPAANDYHYRLAAFNFTNDRLTQCLKLALQRRKGGREEVEGESLREYQEDHKEPEECFTTDEFNDFPLVFQHDSQFLFHVDYTVLYNLRAAAVSLQSNSI